MHSFIKYNQIFADDLKFSMSWGALFLGIVVLIVSVGILWEWKDTKPKDEKFWFCCGILFHWWATVNARALSLLVDSGCILERTEHMLTAFNIVFVIIAGTFYFRALVNHWKPNLWKWLLGATIGIIFMTYVYRVAL